MKTVKLKNNSIRKPWVDEELLYMIQHRNYLFKHYSSQPNDDNLAQFIEYRNKTNSLRRQKNEKLLCNLF